MDEQQRAVQVQLASTGDQDALQRLIIGYHAALRATVDREIDAPLRRHLDPDDVLQEAYAAAFKEVFACRFADPAGFYKWLETIALNELKKRQRNLKAQKRNVARELHSSIDAATSCPDLLHRRAGPDSTPTRRVRRSEAVAAVLSSLARLTDVRGHKRTTARPWPRRLGITFGVPYNTGGTTRSPLGPPYH